MVVISGPIVPAIDFTQSPHETVPSTEPSNASILVVTPPSDEFRIRHGRWVSEIYLDSPPITIYVEEVVGTPILVYELEIRSLGYAAAQLAFLSERNEGQEITLDLQREPLNGERITESSYPTELSIHLRTGNETRDIYRKNVTVTVEGSNSGG